MGFSPKAAFKFSWDTFLERPGVFLGAALIFALVQTLPEYGIVLMRLAMGSSEEVPSWWSRAALESLEVLIVMGSVAFCLKAYDDLEALQLQSLWRPDHYLPYLPFLALWILLWMADLSGFAFVALLFAVLDLQPTAIVDLTPWYIVFDAIGWNPGSPGIYILPGVVFDAVGRTPIDIMDTNRWGVLWIAMMLGPLALSHVLFLVPGFFMIDRNLGALRSLRASIRASKGNRRSILVFVVAWYAIFALEIWLLSKVPTPMMVYESIPLRFLMTTHQLTVIYFVFLMHMLSYAYAYRRLSRHVVEEDTRVSDVFS